MLYRLRRLKLVSILLEKEKVGINSSLLKKVRLMLRNLTKNLVSLFLF
jgi:hypothetical protein